ncbi:MAG: cytochrome P450 [Aeromicrobium sp.]
MAEAEAEAQAERAVTDYASTITIEQLDADPYAVFARLRVEAPFTYVPAANAWFVSRWDDVDELYAASDLVSSLQPHSPSQQVMGVPNILTAEGPTHADLRGALHHMMLPKTVNSYVDAIVQPQVDAGLERISGQREVDLLEEFLEPISVMSTATLLGMGHLDPQDLRRWFADLAVGSTNWERDPVKDETARVAVEESASALADIYDRLEAEPDDSLISALLHTGMPPGVTRERTYIEPTILVILLGGLQEPAHGAGNVLLSLLRHPDQLSRVLDRPAQLMPKAINEGLRWEPPAGTVEKAAQQDFTFRGQQVRRHDNILFMNGSVNRDADHFVDGESFDVFRRESKHRAFGLGHHLCMGHWFSRRLIDISLTRLLDAHPGMSLDPAHANRLEGWVFRGPREGLHVLL